MADKRMMSKSVIDTDVFLDMPTSTQCLYFQLLLRADDDGFLKNAKTIMRTVGASQDDMKLLIAKQYLILFDSGTIVIKHWRIHNYIKKDRYKPTDCEEARLIDVNDKGEYILLEPTCIQNGTTAEPTCIQNGTSGKVRLEIELGKSKGSVNKKIKKESALPAEVKRRKLFTSYQEKIKPISGSVEGDRLSSLLDDYGLDLCLKAIDRAVLRKRRSLRYISGILRSWQKDGYDEPKEENDDRRYVKKSESPPEEVNNIPF
ncbi:DnaD domain-containing protein [Dialister invisus]|jgi:DnaD/phage-associated family protein|uniref:DnaD domain-containing protein n=1 Tax=Dialister invisus TaxID=218538 RepID=UPI003C6EFE5B